MLKPFKIYSSSAGSGKTYTLTKEYLKLVLQSDDPFYFRRILAVTFTNDAANEMKERILAALRGFADPNTLPADKQTANQRLLDAVLAELNETDRVEPLTETTLRRRAGKVFSHLLHDYSDFAVSTIDSFVNRLVGAFTEELDIPFNYELTLEGNELVANAVDRLLNRVGQEAEEALSEMLEAYALEITDEGKSWSGLPTNLAEFGRQLLNEKVTESLGRLSHLTVADFRDIRVRIEEIRAEIQQAVNELAHGCFDLLDAFGLDSPSFQQGSRGIWGYFQRHAESVEREMEKEATDSVKAIFESDEWASKTAKTDKKQQIAELRPQFYGVYERIERLKGEWLLLENVLQHFYRLSVINEIGRELRRLKADKNQVHIGDFNQALISIILSEPVPFIYERLGEKYNHILIDEFQDTSVLQWHNLLPLVENGLAKGHFSLVVGDAKQAIYGFRGGDMEQIVHLSNKRFADLVRRHPTPDLMGTRYDTVGHTLALERLNTNYRSTSEIVTFNNDIFSVLAGLYAENRQLLADVYDAFAAQETPPDARTGGHVEIRFLDTARDDDATGVFSAYELRTLEAVLRTVREAEEIGYELGDIAVLCRFNKNARWVADFLREQGVAVISQDSLLLKSSVAVSLLVAFLRTLHTPADGLARYEALSLFYQHVLQEPPRLNPEEWDRLRGSSSLGPLYRHLEGKGYVLNPFRLQHLGLYELGEKLAQTFQLADMHGQSAYVYRFLDVLLDFSTKQSNHLAAFMEYWERKQDSLCINTPKGAKAVTVTSVHKSKGLEYPVVIVPFADWNMHPRTTEIWWMSLDKSRLAYESPFLDNLPLLATPVTPKKELLRTPLRDQYQADTEKHFIENLNMLYVALTRPTDRLYLLGSKYEEKKGDQVNVSRLLHDYLSTLPGWDAQCPHYILHEGTLKPNAKPEAEVAETLALRSHPVADWHRTARLRRMAARLFDTDTLDRANDPPRLLAEALRRLEDRDQLDVCLDRLEAEGALAAAARPSLRRDLLELLAHPALAPHFAPDAGLKPVKDILSRHTLNLTPPDRVMVTDQAVTIFGYVTQEPTEEDAKVLSRYAKALKQMGYQQVEQLIVNTQTLEVGEEKKKTLAV